MEEEHKGGGRTDVSPTRGTFPEGAKQTRCTLVCTDMILSLSVKERKEKKQRLTAQGIRLRKTTWMKHNEMNNRRLYDSFEIIIVRLLMEKREEEVSFV